MRPAHGRLCGRGRGGVASFLSIVIVLGGSGQDEDGVDRVDDPFEAFTSATITRELPLSMNFPPLSESLIFSPWTVLTDAFFFAAATAAALGTRCGSTW